MSSPGVLGLEAAGWVGGGRVLVVVLIGGEKPPRLMSGSERVGNCGVSFGGTREAIGIQNE